MLSESSPTTSQLASQASTTKLFRTSEWSLISEVVMGFTPSNQSDAIASFPANLISPVSAVGTWASL